MERREEELKVLHDRDQLIKKRKRPGKERMKWNNRSKGKYFPQTGN